MKRILLPVIVLIFICVVSVDGYVLYGKWKRSQAVEQRGYSFRRSGDAFRTGRGYVVFVPHQPPIEATGYPVILFTNGLGENGGDGVRQISNNFGQQVWERKSRFPFLCIAIQGTQEDGWAPDGLDTQFALEILDDVIQQHQGDPQRVIITGPSAGGSGALEIATAYPERFAGVVPVAASSCGLPIYQAVEIFSEAKMPLWCHYNQKDNDNVVQFNSRFKEKLVKAGLSPLFSAYDDIGHNTWFSAYNNPALYQWMSEQRRTEKTHNVLKFEPISTDSTQDWILPEAGDWSLADGTITFHASDESGKSALLLDRDFADVEFHFDYWGTPNGVCVVALQLITETDSTIDNLEILIPHADQGRGGISDSTHEIWYSKSEVVAQQALKINQWNDVRIERIGDRITVKLNGWELTQAVIPQLNGHQIRFGFRATLGNENEEAWRYLRIRRLNRKGDAL